MMILWILAAIFFLAYTNGANDNFKGVATLFGSRTTNYRTALAWGTLTTFAGSLAAIWLSQGLIEAFSGKGLVPAALTGQPAFLLAVGLGAALTVFLATVTGFPVSTTHALTGALLGAGWMAVGSQVNLSVLGKTFFLPLALSPFLSFGITAVVYPLFQFARQAMGVRKQLCLCVGFRAQEVILQPDGTGVIRSSGNVLSVGELKDCVEQYQGVLFGVDCQRVVDFFHCLSAGTVGFARGLNDTPKIVAILLATQALHLGVKAGLLIVGMFMGLGGILSAKKVAQTMGQRITSMSRGQGFTGNLVTSLLVTLASGWGLPVSTTHVSCGALFGIGMVNRKANLDVIRNVVLSWVITLPAAASCAALLYCVIMKLS